MALPEGALTATITVGAASGVAGTPAIISGFTVEADCELTWAPTGEKIETFPDPGEGADGQIVVVADQPGVLTSSTVDDQPAMVEVRAWPLIARWRTTSGPEVRDHRRVLPAPAPGATVDLDTLPKGGVVAPGPVTYAQAIYVGADLIPVVQEAAASAEADAALASTAAEGAHSSATSAAASASTANTAATTAGADSAAAQAAASVAASSAAEVAADALNATAAASEAVESAQSAATSAGVATAAASTAGTAASSASGSASTATGAATTATEQASTAAGAAAAASGSATAAASSASAASSSAIAADGSATSAAASAATASAAQAATEAVDLSIGTVTTGAAGSPAAAAILGEAPDLTLNLTIPRGNTGANGPANALAIGTVSTGTPGSNAAASITGTPPAQTLDLTIPQGATGSPTAFELRGTGMPNGIVTAPVGTYYTDAVGTNGAWRWLKKTGTGNTGWEVVHGDTGWRSIPVALVDWGLPSFRVRRVGHVVDHYFDRKINDTGAGAHTLWEIPVGFKPDVGPTAMWQKAAGVLWDAISGNGLQGAAATSSFTVFGNILRVYCASPGARLGGRMTYTTTDPWPTTLPGTPA